MTTRAKSRRSATFIMGMTLIGLVALVALISFIYLPYPPDQIGGGRLLGPSADHLLGTDALGRDIASQLMIGARLALGVGAASVAIAAVIGVSGGIAAAFAQRWWDDGLAAVMDVAIAFPALLLAMLMVAVFEASTLTVALALGLGMGAVVARLTRIYAKRVTTAQYVQAARTAGSGFWRILATHVWPNLWPSLIVVFALEFGVAVLAEASLSYLGLGAPPPTVSWGGLLKDAQATVYAVPVGAIAPGIALLILVLGSNTLADGLRDVLDPTRRHA